MGDCIIHPGWCNERGYGKRTWKGKTRLAHRVAYCEHHGIDIEDIKGKVVRHKCDNPPCINAKHLELGAQVDNVRDCVERGRRRYAVRFTQEQRAEIRKLYVPHSRQYGVPALARQYQCAQDTIARILSEQ